ncbi:AMP-binding protein [Streptomyces sp. NA02950]|uniref:AMP-binding protein n=1 Tax=Streptomyces sp. NA02950 TaxID=2742137 RepID=UPI0015929EE0|nr:AMP-binding protein [Streptomyces sp. NA02950]QKV96149.1 AMP-binding protein [Streptomyces sp. NA02950]
MNLVQALAEVANRGTGHGLRLFRGDEEAERVTYGELYADAGRLACGLLERGVRQGERVAIALPTSIDFARAFFGVLAAGAVPVPLPPPVRFASLDIHLSRIALAMRQSKVRVVLSDSTLGRLMGPVLGGADGEFEVLDTALVRAAGTEYADVPDEAPGLVQYTSGTSQEPKGVVLSHANLLANVAAITKGLDVTDAEVCCNWLPLFHDMGLIGTLLTPVFNGAEALLLPPEDFLRDPGRWLRIISGYHGTATTAPNSGYLHALRKVPADKVHGLDLSRWRVALNGAEAIDPGMMRRFSEHFAPAGFHGSAFLPVYGLAEGSLAVTFAPLGRRSAKTIWVRREPLADGVVEPVSPEAGDTASARELVSVGVPVANTEVRLVDDDGAVLSGEARVGEIQIRGDSVMRAYEADEAATRATVHAGGWVSTGDVALRRDGELFIVGRTKEMIIIFGQNYHASDIESVAGRVPGVANNAVLAMAVATADGEGLALVAETKEADPAVRAQLVGQLRHAVSDAIGISPHDVILVRRGTLPRTSSGKLQRYGTEALVTAEDGDGASR